MPGCNVHSNFVLLSGTSKVAVATAPPSIVPVFRSRSSMAKSCGALPSLVISTVTFSPRSTRVSRARRTCRRRRGPLHLPLPAPSRHLPTDQTRCTHPGVHPQGGSQQTLAWSLEVSLISPFPCRSSHSRRYRHALGSGRALGRHARQQLIQPLRDPPVPVPQHLHGRRHQQKPNDCCIDKNCDGESETEYRARCTTDQSIDHMIRIVVADDQALVRKDFTLLLDSEKDIEVVGEAADGAEAVELAHRLEPDVVLMDVRMPHVDGIEAT